jgi:hypothetical protein
VSAAKSSAARKRLFGQPLTIDEILAERDSIKEQRDMLLGALQRAIPEIAVCCAADVLEQARAAIEAASKPQP